MVITVIDRGTTGIKEVVTLTSDLSRKNLEKDFERMDTPQGTFYRKSSGLVYHNTLESDELQACISTSCLPWTDPSSTQSWSVRVRSWVVARQDLGDGSDRRRATMDARDRRGGERGKSKNHALLTSLSGDDLGLS